MFSSSLLSFSSILVDRVSCCFMSWLQEKEKPSKNLESVGAFQKLPMVMPSLDIFYSALKKAKRVSPTKGIFSSMWFCLCVYTSKAGLGS